MAQQTLKTISDLGRVDRGVLDKQFKQAFTALLEDLMDRPGVKSVREIQIIMRAVPVADASGALAGVEAEFEVKAKNPTSRTRTISMGCKGVEGLVFQDLSPDDHNQRTIDELVHDDRDNPPE